MRTPDRHWSKCNQCLSATLFSWGRTNDVQWTSFSEHHLTWYSIGWHNIDVHTIKKKTRGSSAKWEQQDQLPRGKIDNGTSRSPRYDCCQWYHRSRSNTEMVVDHISPLFRQPCFLFSIGNRRKNRLSFLATHEKENNDCFFPKYLDV